MQHLVASFGAPCWLPPLVWVEFAPPRQDGASRVPMVRVSVVVSYGTSKLLVRHGSSAGGQLRPPEGARRARRRDADVVTVMLLSLRLSL